jgi:ornithine cyclodeaminase
MAARQITEIRVYARTAEHREDFAAGLADELGPAARVVAAESPEATVRGADVVCCATTSFEPIFSAEWVDPGTHISAVGSFQKGMVELPPQLFADAALVAVDSRAAVLEEAGDLLAAIETGRLAADGFVEIGSVDGEWSSTRDPAAITVFKSVGLAIQDLATAELVIANLGPAVGGAG